MKATKPIAALAIAVLLSACGTLDVSLSTGTDGGGAGHDDILQQMAKDSEAGGE